MDSVAVTRSAAPRRIESMRPLPASAGERLLKAAAGVVVAAWAVVSLTWPFGWDQGILAWIGDVINHGGVQYRDAWDQAGPLPPLLHALADRVAGRNTWGIRVVDLALLLLSAGVLRAEVGRLTNASAGTWAALLFVLWYASGSFWHTAQRDGWAAMATLVALAPLIGSDIQRARLARAGLLLGVATLIKPYFAAFFLVPALAVRETGRPVRDQAAALAWVALGALAPILLTGAWFAYHGALDDLFEAYLRYPFEVYSAPLGVEARLQGLIEYGLTGNIAVLLLPASLCGLLIAWRQVPAVARPLAAWAALAVTGVFLQGRFFDYHWIPIFAPAIVLAAVGLGGAAPAANRSGAPDQVFVTVYLCLLLAHAAIHPVYDIADAARRAIAGEAPATGAAARADAQAATQAAAYIRSNTAPEDRIFVWGWHASIYYLADRRSATRFGFSMPLMMGEGTELYRRYRAEFLREIGSARPAFVVIGPLSTNILGVKRDERDFPEFWTFVERCYRPEETFGDLRIYRYQAVLCAGAM